MLYLDEETDSTVNSTMSNGELLGTSKCTSNTISKAEQRKKNKPLIEKFRRGRINNSVNKLKDLLLEATIEPKEHPRQTAHILEMTVDLIKRIKNDNISKYKDGFTECMLTVKKFIDNQHSLDDGVKKRLESHLDNSFYEMQFSNKFLPSLELSDSSISDIQSLPLSPSSSYVTPIQLVPSNLHTGEVALLLPANKTSDLFNYFLPEKIAITKSFSTSLSQNFQPKSSPVEVSSTSGLSTENSNFERIIPELSISNMSSLIIPITELNPEYRRIKYGEKDDDFNTPLSVNTKLPSNSDVKIVEEGPLDFSLEKKSHHERSNSTNCHNNGIDNNVNLHKKRSFPYSECKVLVSKYSKVEVINNNKDKEMLAIDNSGVWRPW